MDIKFPSSVKKYVDLQCNGALYKYTDMPELEHIEKELLDINPKNVLEIGSGIGRASVYLFKYFNWDNTVFHLLDGNSGDEQAAGVNYKVKEDFYNSITATKDFCYANGMKNFYLMNAENAHWLNADVKFDLCYSFLAIGFHWPINYYLDLIYDMLLPGCLLIFGTRPSDKKFDEFVNTQISAIDVSKYEIVKLKRGPKKSRNSVIILRKI